MGKTRLQDFKARLAENIAPALEERKESHKMAMNSYGAGWDAGYHEALCRIQSFIDGDEDAF